MPTFTVNGFANKPIGTNLIGTWQVYNSVSSNTPTINGTNFSATLTQSTFGTQTVVAVISDMAGNVGVKTNQFVWTAYTTGNYSSDAAGCVTQIVYQGPVCEQSKVLSWDAEYHLTSVKTNGAISESYIFDPYGRRISTTTSDGTVTRYLNDGQHILADLNSTGGVLRSYLYGPNTDELLAMTVYTGSVAQTYYPIRDHQNTVWGWVNTNGVAVENYDMDAWGRLLSVTDGNGNVLSSSAIGNRFLFQGREYSFNTGLYYFRQRFYDPIVGRWINNDPTGINGGLNQFIFCNNNPVIFVDTDGLTAYSFDFIGPLQLGDYYEGTCTFTAYSDKHPGADWRKYKPKKKGGKPSNVNSGDAACANTSPKPWDFGTKVYVYDNNGNLIFNLEVHDTGAGWDSNHQNVPPQTWFDIWMPNTSDAETFGVKTFKTRVYPPYLTTHSGK